MELHGMARIVHDVVVVIGRQGVQLASAIEDLGRGNGGGGGGGGGAPRDVLDRWAKPKPSIHTG